MIGIRPPSLTSQLQPLPVQAPPPRPDVRTSNRPMIHLLVDPYNLHKIADIFFNLAGENCIRDVSVVSRQTFLSDAVDPPRMLMPLTLKFSPDLPRGRFSPEYLKNINRVKAKLDQALLKSGVRTFSPK